MSQLIKLDEAEWIQNVGPRFKSMQIKAATKVNQEMLRFYSPLDYDSFVMILPRAIGGRIKAIWTIQGMTILHIYAE